MILPPIINIITGQNEQTRRMYKTVRLANRPHNKGMRKDPYDGVILHYAAGTGMQFSAPDMASIDLVSIESERVNELIVRVTDLEQQLAELRTIILSK
jgi:hypothetical protein